MYFRCYRCTTTEECSITINSFCILESCEARLLFPTENKRYVVVLVGGMVHLSAAKIVDCPVIEVYVPIIHILIALKEHCSTIFPNLASSHGLAVTKPNLAIAGIFGHGAVRLNNRYGQEAELAEPKPSRAEPWQTVF